MILPGTTVTVKNRTSIYWGYVGFVQRISGDKAAVLILAKYQYQIAFVADQEINLLAALTEIMVECEFR